MKFQTMELRWNSLMWKEKKSFSEEIRHGAIPVVIKPSEIDYIILLRNIYFSFNYVYFKFLLQLSVNKNKEFQPTNVIGHIPSDVKYLYIRNNCMKYSKLRYIIVGLYALLLLQHNVSHVTTVTKSNVPQR
jgi:hypothetical protein